ncbi:MAG: sugar phosphate isomerase/epimerase family protein [bacterium]|jgi:sugar phosphate isomerase/epimerase
MGTNISRRTFLSTAAAIPLVPAVAQSRKIPVGLELYSVRNELSKDLEGTVTAVARMGYENVEFYSPYFSWTLDRAKEVRKLLDDLGITCRSTHNGPESFAPANYQKAIDLNGILGSRLIVMASAGRVQGIDGWKKVADTLNAGAEAFRKAKMSAGYHNHQLEFRSVEGTRPIEVIAKNTMKDVVLQLDIGTCVEVGQDPVAWIEANPGRIRSVHCKEWSPEKGYKALFGEGASPWKKIFAAAEKTGGVEDYIIEQEVADIPTIEAVEKCLAAFRKMRA